jgi:alpha-amylase
MGHHDDIWCDSHGNASYTIPANAWGGGGNTLWFSVTQNYVPNIITQSLKTVQEFEGADDLDIGPAVAGKTTEVTRIWVALGTTVDLKLTHPAFGGVLSPVATDPQGRGITSALPSDTLSFAATTEGWHELKVSATGAAPGTKIPFTLAAVYEAPVAAALA